MKKIFTLALAAILLVQTAVFAIDRGNATNTVVVVENDGNETVFFSAADAEYIQNGGDIETVVNSENTITLTGENAQSFMDDWREGREEKFIEQLSAMETFIVSPEVPTSIVRRLREFIADNNIDVNLVIGERGGEFHFGIQEATVTFAEPPAIRPPADMDLILSELFYDNIGQHANFTQIIREVRIHEHEHVNGFDKILDGFFASGEEYIDFWVMQAFDIANGMDFDTYALRPEQRSLFREYRLSSLNEQTACESGVHIGEIMFDPEIDIEIRRLVDDVAVLIATRTGVCSVSGTTITETSTFPFFPHE
ncbi:MAG: hypothetical protein FWG65_05710 [Turicibacter sp.]|nr:hypothetical protein [Turicibacter sp.]